MNILEFRLKGETAFFKIPQLNSYRYMTYSCVHKVALLGLFGSILGLGGYGQQEGDYPEFYQRLKGLKCAIEIEDLGGIKKKFQQFNNSVGYASFEKGNNLIVTEQWLEKPSWKIRLLIDTVPEDLKLVEKIVNRQASFPPYLGKNDHFASIEDIRLLEGQAVENLGQGIELKGLVGAEDFTLQAPRRKVFQKYEEQLPVGLDPNLNQYTFRRLRQSNGLYTRKEGLSLEEEKIYKIEEAYYYFF